MKNGYNIEIFMFGFILAFAITSIFWNIPEIMKKTYTYQDLVIKVNQYDVNRDGIVNSQDYVLIKNYIMKGE
jgi:hypothetical protein